jgi:hypothetical protein
MSWQQREHRRLARDNCVGGSTRHAVPANHNRYRDWRYRVPGIAVPRHKAGTPYKQDQQLNRKGL